MSNKLMTTLRELLERVTAEHPAPWVFRPGNEDAVIDANGAGVFHDYMCLNSDVLPALVSLVNAAAAEVGR